MQKQFFTKYLLVVSLSFFLTLILAFITANNSFPLGEDLAGGTQMIYKLDHSEIDAEIATLRQQISIGGPNLEDLQRRLESRLASLNQSRGNVADIIRKRADPTGTKNVRVEMIDNNEKMRVAMPSASPVLVLEVQRRIMTQGRLTIHHVMNPDETIGTPMRAQYDKLYATIEEKVKHEFPGKTAAEAYDRPEAPKNPSLQEQREHSARIADWETKWLAVVKQVNHELFDAEHKFLYVIDYREASAYGRSALEQKESDLWKRDQLIMKRDAGIKGSDIESASSTALGEKGPEVNIRFTAAGGRTFGEWTERLCQAPYTPNSQRMAIVLDGWARSAPTVTEPIKGGGCRISGAMDPEEAKRVSGVLNAGSLAFQLAKESETSTGPTLGHESIRQGMWATLVGSILVVAFMLLYYRRVGTIACMALFFNLIMLMGLMCFIKATLTLPGIAGILLTIGMAVDANVLIYERIREEMAKGRTVRAAVEQGFDRAFVTIVDSNLTTLIIGIVLYYLGTGPVKGFAMTLSLGILTSLFAGIFITRTLMETYILRNTPGGGKTQMAVYFFFHFLAALYFLTSANSEVIAHFGSFEFAADKLFAATIVLVGGASYFFVEHSKDEGKSQRFMTVALVTTGLLAAGAFFLYMGPDVTGSMTSEDSFHVLRHVTPLEFTENGDFQGLRLGLILLAPALFITVAAVSAVYSRGDWTGLTMSDWFKLKRDFDIMSQRHKFILVSIGLNIAGVIAFASVQGSIYDTDFTGGTELIVNLRQRTDVELVRTMLGDLKQTIEQKVELQKQEITAVIKDIPTIAAGPEGLNEEFDPRPWIATGLESEEDLKRSPKLHLPFTAEQLDEALLKKFNTKRKLYDLLLSLEDELPKVKQEEFKAVAYGSSGQSFQINTGINSLLMQAVFDNAVHDKLKDVLQDEPGIVTPAGDRLRFRFTEYNNKEHGAAGQDPAVLKELRDAIQEVAERHRAQPEVYKALDDLKKGVPQEIAVTTASATMREEHYLELPAAGFPIASADKTVVTAFAPYGAEIIRQFQQKPGAQSRAASNWRESLTVVDSSISTSTKVSALVALLLSMVAICIYVWIRFDFIFGYGLGAIISLIHDVAVVLLIYSIASLFLDIKMNMDAVAAILTLVGYSINDTIVIFDRVREERRAHRTRDVLRVMNDSINRTLSRTMLTGCTTLLAILSLLFFGGQSLMGLSLILFVGILTGTYSSIYIACPFVHWWITRKGGKGELEHNNLVAANSTSAQ